MKSEILENSSDNYPKVYLYKRIVQAKLFIDDHYSDNIDLNNIADEAYFSKFHFIKLFKTIYGKTPHQYLIYVRVEKAMELLRNDYSVSDVCTNVGFESLTSFSGLFKRIVGITPSAYFLQQKKLRALMLSSSLNFIPGCHVNRSN
jgi:AraC-like DNA-binding protein